MWPDEDIYMDSWMMVNELVHKKMPRKNKTRSMEDETI